MIPTLLKKLIGLIYKEVSVKQVLIVTGKQAIEKVTGQLYPSTSMSGEPSQKKPRTNSEAESVGREI